MWFTFVQRSGQMLNSILFSTHAGASWCRSNLTSLKVLSRRPEEDYYDACLPRKKVLPSFFAVVGLGG